MDTAFLTFVVGPKRSLHRQANLAVISLLARLDPADAATVFVVTDRPECYRWLGEAIRLVVVDEPTLADWRGPVPYFWRLKIRAMQRVHELAPGHLAYLDSDVVARSNLREFLAELHAGQPFMHELHYRLGHKGGTGRKLWRQAGGRRYGAFGIDAQSPMWNAGLVALPADRCSDWLADALGCVDAMCAAGIESPVIEQFALSLSLDRDGRLQPADRWFIHYWSNKIVWNAFVNGVLADFQLEGLSVAESCARFRELALDLPMGTPRGRLEKLGRSLRKRFAPRSDSVVEQFTRVVTD